MKKKDKKNKKSGKRRVIILIVLLIIIVIGIVGYFIYQSIQYRKPIGKEWGEEYFDYIESNISSKKDKNINSDFMNDASVGFIEVDKKRDPIMIVESNDSDVTVIYPESHGEMSSFKWSGDGDIELLYNYSLGDYRWYYISDNKKDKKTYYEDIGYIVDEYIAKDEYGEGSDEYTAVLEKSTSNMFTFDMGDDNKINETFIELSDASLDTCDIKSFNKMSLKSSIRTATNEYKSNDSIITKSDKSKVKRGVSLYNKKQEEKELEARKLTQDNLLTKVGEQLKYFAGAWSGSTYGIRRLYNLNNVTGSVNVPGASSEEMTYEVVGLNSVSELNGLLNKYMDSSVVSRLKSRDDITKTLHDYNGKVYYIMGGIGDSSSFNYRDAKLISSDGDTSKVEIDEINAFTNSIDSKVYVTIKYDKDSSSYIITDYS